MFFTGIFQAATNRRFFHGQKWILTGTVHMLAVALDAVNIDAADADISAFTLSEVEGVACCKVGLASVNFCDSVG